MKKVENTEKTNKGKKREKKAKEPRAKKVKTEAYILRKNTAMVVLRAVFWGMLIFAFIRGVIDIFKPEDDTKVEYMIQNFREDFSEFNNQNAEVMSFAQNFAMEYLTYEKNGEVDYSKRIEPYISPNITASNLYDFSNAAKAVYAQAYRVDEYSQNQVDVYVLAKVEYSRRVMIDEESYTTETTEKELILSIPVYMSGGAYVVESVPLLVSDTMYLEEYAPEEYYGTTISESMSNQIKTSVNNFLKAYCEQEESVINYYLSPKADKSVFAGLDAAFTFEGIESFKCYQETGDDIVCIVSYEIRDIENDVSVLQKINLSIQESGGKFYINDMDTRTGNLNK